MRQLTENMMIAMVNFFKTYNAVDTHVKCEDITGMERLDFKIKNILVYYLSSFY